MFFSGQLAGVHPQKVNGLGEIKARADWPCGSATSGIAADSESLFRLILSGLWLHLTASTILRPLPRRLKKRSLVGANTRSNVGIASMRTFGKRVDLTTGGRRDAPREPIIVPAALLTLHHSQSVVIADISSSGAALLGRNLPSEFEDVWLKVGTVDVLGTVVWRKGRFCGLTFDAPLSDRQLNYIRREASAIMLGGVTPEEKKTIKAWQARVSR
jgi:hypothetical protein